MIIDEQWADEMYNRGIEASRIGREKQERKRLEELHELLPDERSYMVGRQGGLYDVYKNGEYFDTFDTKGKAWNALYEG